MTTKIGVSLPDSTYERAVRIARASGTSMSGLVDAALRAEITRQELADHMTMLAAAEAPDELHATARARTAALAAWKRSG